METAEALVVNKKFDELMQLIRRWAAVVCSYALPGVCHQKICFVVARTNCDSDIVLQVPTTK